MLAGGGLGAIAWELGVLRGLADADADLAQTVVDADTVVGTSGGRLTSEIDPDLDLTDFVGRFNLTIAGATGEIDRRRRIGTFAMAAATVTERERLAVIAARLRTTHWPRKTYASSPSTQPPARK